jgi:hypothetical protein
VRYDRSCVKQDTTLELQGAFSIKFCQPDIKNNCHWSPLVNIFTYIDVIFNALIRNSWEWRRGGGGGGGHPIAMTVL